MITFAYREQDTILHGKQVYRKSEYAFDFLPENQDELSRLAGGMGNTSLSVGTLQIEVGIENRNLLYVWGYHPYFNWRTAAIPEIKVRPGSVILSSSHELRPGVSLVVDEGQSWQTFCDTGWARVLITKREVLPAGDSTFIEIASGCFVELVENSLVSLVLHLVKSNEE